MGCVISERMDSRICNLIILISAVQSISLKKLFSVPSLPLILLLRFMFGIVNAVDVTEDLCNSDCLVLWSSADSIKAAVPSPPCLCPSSSICISFLMFCLFLKPFLHDY